MEKEKYSKKLFDELFKKVQEELKKELKGLCINFKGLWAFSYLAGANKLQSVYFKHVDDSLKSSEQYQKIFEKIEGTSLDCDYGSLGDSLRSFNENPGKFSDFLSNTFDDPKGTVCYYDTLINQQHASFIIIKDDEGKILGALDFFFESISNCAIATGENKIIEYFNKSRTWLSASSITALKIQEHEYFLKIQKEKGSGNTLPKDNTKSAIKHIEELLALSSKTPLMIISHKNGNTTSSLVCLNFDFIHSIIKHEHRFCPLTDDTKNCFHFKKLGSFSGDRNTLSCTNDFLDNYYYKVFATLDAKRLYKQIKVDGTEYELGIVTKKNEAILLKEISVSKEIGSLQYEPFSDLAKEKYQDERVFMNVEKQLNAIKDVYAFSLSRLKSKIKCTINCNSDEKDCSVRNAWIGGIPLKQFISPSNILPIQHGTETKNDQFEKDGSQDSNIVHFQILKEEIFIETLKKLIIKDPKGFIDIIKPYVDNEKKLNQPYDQLILKYAGHDPLTDNNDYVEIIKGKLNLIEAILQEKESENLATRAAIAQVNARNNSHNIGAHVMNKLTSPHFLENFCSYTNCLKSYKPDKDFEGSEAENHKPFNQLAIFNNYVKCRMDYLADIALGTPLMQTNKYAYSDLFKELDKVRLLLEHISGLSDFKYKIEFKKNGHLLTEDNDLPVAIPNDILGMQAFYNILENIIRNTAKHGSNKPTLTVFTVNFIDEYNKERNGGTETEIKNILNEFIAVEVYDNIPVVGTGRDIREDEQEEYRNKMDERQLEGFKTRIDALVFTQNWNLNKDILSENRLRSSSLGLVEMDASAAYLRKRDVSFINHPSYDIQYDESWSRDTELNGGKQDVRGTNCRHFLKAFKKEATVRDENGNDKTENYLGYRFFLHRPALALVVTDKIVENKDALKKNGIWIVPHSKTNGEKDNNFEAYLKAGKVYNHEFVVIGNEVKFDKIGETEFLEHYKTSLPIRILNTINNLSDLLAKPADEIEKICWEKWEIQNNINILGRYNLQDDKFQAVFLDHLYSDNKEVKCTCGKGDLCSNAEWCNNKDANYAEALSSLGQSKLPDFSRLTKEVTNVNDKLQKYIDSITKPNAAILCEQGLLIPEEFIANKKIIEAVQTKVIVIDERIQEAAEKNNFIKVPYKELYAKINVVVPDKKTLDLSESSFEDAKKGVEDYIKKEVRNLSERDFILIHYSILERMYPKEEINEKLEDLIGGSKINVAVTSGRGIPDNLSEKVRFINLSSIITAFVDIRCKYSINYLLNSTRKSSKI